MVLHRACAVALLLAIAAAGAASYSYGYYVGTSSHPSAGLDAIAASLYAPYLSEVLRQSGTPGSVAAMGSVAAAQQVVLDPSGYGIFLSVDPSVIEDILYPKYASWYIAIAGDSMTIGVSRSFPKLQELEALNETLAEAIASGNEAAEKEALASILGLVLSGNYTVGTSNPNTDPEGYRALMVLQLAGLWLQGNSSYYVAKLDALNSTGRLYEASMGSALFSYVESGKVDFDLAIYQSTAVHQGMLHIELPPQVNLGSANYSGFYGLASVAIISGGREVELHGAPIYICFTIPNEYPDKGLAAAAALYMLTPGGRGLLSKYGAAPLSTPLLYGNESQVPYPLSSLLNTSVLQYGGPID